mmetsp:Transcript_62413/g.180948  ORF Transcript_62413/g.180948 Transcript_62413/m.180948 type:complete len:213 (+) Transcript_62413:94-732(+)
MPTSISAAWRRPVRRSSPPSEGLRSAAAVMSAAPQERGPRGGGGGRGLLEAGLWASAGSLASDHSSLPLLSASSPGSGSGGAPHASPAGRPGGRRGSSARSGRRASSPVGAEPTPIPSTMRSCTASRKTASCSCVGSGASNVSFTLTFVKARNHNDFSEDVRAQSLVCSREKTMQKTPSHEPIATSSVMGIVVTNSSHHSSLYTASCACPRR